MKRLSWLWLVLTLLWAVGCSSAEPQVTPAAIGGGPATLQVAPEKLVSQCGNPGPPSTSRKVLRWVAGKMSLSLETKNKIALSLPDFLHRALF